MSKTFIYKITNQINQKVYIGKTLNTKPTNRWARHLSTAKHKTTYNHSYQAIHKSINKHGKENFTFEVIEECDLESEGLEREKFWIEHFKSNILKYGNEFGYNLTAGGDGSSGFKHSKESKEKMSKTRKGTRLGESNTFYGKHHSDETKEILRIKGEERNPMYFKGRQHTDETKALISVKNSGKKRSIEVTEKSSKLKSKDIIDIRYQFDNNLATIKELSVKYGVHKHSIWLTVRRKIWKNI